MASPPDCPFCSATPVTTTDEYYDAESPGVSLVLLSCGHAVVTQGGAWVRLGSVTGKGSVTATDSSNLEKGAPTLSSASIASFKKATRGKRG